ncbi:PP2C family serine/threonine-protein phosphatase [Amycolatopsis sp. 195334CR]|uniref:PP2C family protein-serine/threonine phosphatase n=1 Tax=Amycolatopsis sp. 195334CR TaxID=2814588 RepID=UPI001A8CE9BB|nr:protein phosphatase 2C domain-containing protein [Amycolatopsis sp. 195334CR]MBN6041724.1 serine/threonine-protein phosphatase [Amycolatopsis sp. 195334CR]
MTHEFRAVVGTDPGLNRKGNEDAAFAGSRVLVLADGMGGHTSGEVASALAVDALRELDEGPHEDLTGALAKAVAEAGRLLNEHAPAGAGTTVTAMLWDGPRFGLAHVGDSRGYLLRDSILYQMTRDHTLVQTLVDEGRITPEEAEVHPRRSMLVRALQSGSTHDPDLSEHEAAPGDRYLLCSDGLTDVVRDEAIREVLDEVADPEAAVHRLIALANAGGGPDNITCVLADYPG